jgi:hypothetical protein
MLGFQVYVLLFSENVGLPDYKIIYVPTGISNIVGNSSGAIRDISCLFEDGHLHLRSSSFCPTASTHTCRIPTYNYKLHFFLLDRKLVVHCLFANHKFLYAKRNTFADFRQTPLSL